MGRGAGGGAAVVMTSADFGQVGQKGWGGEELGGGGRGRGAAASTVKIASVDFYRTGTSPCVQQRAVAAVKAEGHQLFTWKSPASKPVNIF